MSGAEQLQLICRRFLKEDPVSAEPLEEGHINDTYLVRTDSGKYVLQRLRKKMDPKRLIYNYGLYAPVFEAHGFLYPKWLRDEAGEYFYTDECGDRWRMYPYIEGEVLSTPLTGEQLFACGQGLARVHRILKELPGAPQAVYPILHDLRYYYDRYLELLNGGDIMEENRDPAVEAKLAERLGAFLTVRSECPENNPGEGVVPNCIAPANDIAIIHGDAKLSNMLFRNGQVVGMLDLDTVMAGSVTEELADCIRSCCVNRGTFDREAADILADGYRGGAAISHLPQAFNKIHLELALRYYTDALSKEKHFKERYPGYRLERVRELLGVTWR
ncbi:MAG: aminoglycoside phosphotransferase family protein [Lachnospiraceae bacterium]|nr:aminoglycoside phosphotransferase family protein [Lachnospiraceae bacterium]